MGSSLVYDVAYQKYLRHTCSKTFKEEHWKTLSNFGVFQGVILADTFTIIVRGFFITFHNKLNEDLLGMFGSILSKCLKMASNGNCENSAMRSFS